MSILWDTKQKIKVSKKIRHTKRKVRNDSRIDYKKKKKKSN